MTEQELRAVAALNELKAHLDAALQRCVNLASDLAVAQAKIAEMSKPPEPPPEQPCNTPPLP